MTVARSSLTKVLGRVGRRTPLELAGLGAVIIFAALLSDSAEPSRAQAWTLWVIYGLLALSFTFVWGHGGIFSLGQAAFFGVGGYMYGAAGINLAEQTNETLSALLIGALAAALFAAALGYLMFYGNVGDVYVAIITIAVTLVLLTFMASTADPSYHIGDALIGGYNGMIGIPPVTLPGGMVLEGNNLLFGAIVAAALTAYGLRLLLRRPFGRVLAGVRENEQRTQFLGYDVRRYKLFAFCLGAAIAGFAGGLFASWGAYINPDVFGLQAAALVAIWVLVGGRKALLGAFVGAAVVQGVTDELGASASGATIPILLGSVLIAIVLFLPEGIVPTLTDLAKRLVRWRPQRPSTPLPQAGNGQVPFHGSQDATSIEAVDLHKQFGGLAALEGASLEVAPNGVRCVIGPNGAGKSTLFNLLVGRYRPTSGEVLLGTKSLAGRRPDERARLGLGIKFQVPSIYADLPVFENVWLAAYAGQRNVAAATKQSEEVLAWLNLSDKMDEPASALSHGEQQWLEIGMVMARAPKVILLDEPTAGMTRAETDRAVELIHELAQFATVLVVEHDMEFVRQVGAPVTMFHDGRVFASGSLEEIRADERVLDIYLGRTAPDASG